MPTPDVFIGDLGHTFTVTITDSATGEPLDVSGATTQEVRFYKTNGTTTGIAATHVTDGTDGKLVVTTPSTLFQAGAPVGTWKYGGYVVLADGATHTSTTEDFVVGEP